MYSAYMSITQTKYNVIERCKQITQCGQIRESASTRFQAWTWRYEGPNVIRILKEIYPYLMVKNEQAKVAVMLQSMNIYSGRNNQYQNTIKKGVLEEKDALWQLGKALNQRVVESSMLPNSLMHQRSDLNQKRMHRNVIRK